MISKKLTSIKFKKTLFSSVLAIINMLMLAIYCCLKINV